MQAVRTCKAGVGRPTSWPPLLQPLYGGGSIEARLGRRRRGYNIWQGHIQRIRRMHHKRKRSANRRAGCKLCKPWKVNGYRTGRAGGEGFGNHRRRVVAAEESGRAGF